MTYFSHKKLADKMGAFGRFKKSHNHNIDFNAIIFRDKPYDNSMKEYFIDLVDTKANQMRHDYTDPDVFLNGTDLETIKKQVLWKLIKALESSSVEYDVPEKDYHESIDILGTFLDNLQLLHEDYKDPDKMDEEEELFFS